MATAYDWLQQLAKKGLSCPPVTLMRGEDGYVESALKDAFRAAGYEIETLDWKERGPSSDVEAACLSVSLFSPKRILWSRRPGPASKWSAEDEARWESIRRAVDGEQLIVLLQIPSDKRLKWKHLGDVTEIGLEVPLGAKRLWIERMNSLRKAGLDAERIRFLSELEADLSQIDSYVELWALGGDAWAERGLGFRPGTSNAREGASASGNPAFDWVDAVLAGDASRGIRYLDKLEEEGAEPLQLPALASKSVRILATLEDGRTPSEQPEFLVGKMKGVLRNYPASRRGRGRRLLQACAQLDRKLKSSAQDPCTLLRTLCQ